jgi:hypothetical protein
MRRKRIDIVLQRQVRLQKMMICSGKRCDDFFKSIRASGH